MNPLEQLVLEYIQYASGIVNNPNLGDNVKPQMLQQMAQSLNVLVPLIQQDDKQAEQQMEIEKHQSELQMAREKHQLEMETNAQKHQLELQKSNDKHQLGLVQQAQKAQNTNKPSE